MAVEHMPAVMRVETENYQYPWSEGIFRDCMKVGYQCHVYSLDDEVFAYSIVSNLAAECHVLNVSISPDQQGNGFGRFIVECVLEDAIILGSQQAILEVRPSNVIARNLYFSLGFEQIGVRKDYYPGEPEREDALVLAFDLTRSLR